MMPRMRSYALLAVAMLLLSLAGGITTAQGATYSVWSCRGPDGKPISAQAWQPADASGATSDKCAEGGDLRARLLPQDNLPGTARGFRLSAPQGTKISAYRVHLYASTAKAEWLGAYQAGVGPDAGLSGAQIEAGCVSAGCIFGVPDDPLSEKNLIEDGKLEESGLVVAALCAGRHDCNAQEGEQALAEVRLFRSEIEIEDQDAPTLGSLSGPLTGDEEVSGHATVGAQAADVGGGVASVALLIDGNEAGRWDASCTEPYTETAPCPARALASFQVDAGALEPGTHSAALRATDAAGNVTTGESRDFTVADPPAPPAPPPPVTVPVTVTVERLVPTTLLVPVEPKQVVITTSRSRIGLEDRDARVEGTVKLADGAPAAGARVIVRSRPFGVRRIAWGVERRVTADSSGRFSIDAGDVSRLVQFDVDDSTHRARSAAEVELMQPLRAAINVSGGRLRNGSLMTMRASVSGAGRGASGTVALVQAVVGGRWTTVESLALDRRGRATWRYRFRGTTRRAIYRFRVRVENAGDIWPWRTTTSRVLRVGVSPR